LVALSVLLAPVFLRSQSTLTVGEVATQDITANRALVYVSKVSTEQAREKAASAVSPVYDPPDEAVLRRQIANAQVLFDYIKIVRTDEFSTNEQKVADLQNLQFARLTTEQANAVLALKDDEWASLSTEALRVLETSLSRQVRDYELTDVKERIPILIRFTFNEKEITLIQSLIQEFIVINSILNEGKTAEEQQKARDNVPQQERSYQVGQVIVARGDTIDELDAEAYNEMNLQSNNLPLGQKIGVPVTAWLCYCIGATLFLRRFYPPAQTARLQKVYLGMIWVVSLVLGQILLAQNRQEVSFLFPLAALAILVQVGSRSSVAIGFSTLFTIFLLIFTQGSIQLTLYHLLTAIAAVLAMGKAARINEYFRAGAVVAVIGFLSTLSGELIAPYINWSEAQTRLWVGTGQGFLSAPLALAIIFALSRPFQLLTAIQIVDLSRHSHPLLQEMLRKAPGTYQHSLQIANLVEQAAQEIGANEALVHLLALYHDIGKTLRPEYFIENQLGGMNPHDFLSPLESSRIVVSHVTDGLTMAKQHNLPPPIQQAIMEHHGTLVTLFQYNRAIAEANGDKSKVDMTQFQYPGPRPRTKENALLMLADAVEAKARADLPKTPEALENLVDAVLRVRLEGQQLDESGLTLNDLQKVRKSFVQTLQSFYHARLRYPDFPESTTQPPATTHA
jgi:putative nucleotidyltransferase with HDIG domain